MLLNQDNLQILELIVDVTAFYALIIYNVIVAALVIVFLIVIIYFFRDDENSEKKWKTCCCIKKDSNSSKEDSNSNQSNAQWCPSFKFCRIFCRILKESKRILLSNLYNPEVWLFCCMIIIVSSILVHALLLIATIAYEDLDSFFLQYQIYGSDVLEYNSVLPRIFPLPEF